MSILLLGADLYGLKLHLRKKAYSSFRPNLSIVIPAHNEEKSIIHAISSVLTNNYPQEKLQVIVINDGSTDKTLLKISLYKLKHKVKNLIIVSHDKPLGKAHALNNGIKNYATGELVMCLDADSYLGKNALRRAVRYFTDEKLVALASNIKIEKTKGLVNLVQIFEYVVAYQMKRAHSQFNIEYIIGGIGSMFRKSFLKKIKYYDTNTVTEDIDITMKILQYGNKNIKIAYAPDVISYTEGAHTIKDLMRQRYRWKWGRYQTFLKNKKMFFTKNKSFTKGLTWGYLPYALWSDAAFFFEPFLIISILVLAIFYKEPYIIISAILVMTFFLAMNIVREDTVSFKTKLILLLIAPTMYVFFFILSFVEYAALIKSWKNMPVLKKSLSGKHNTWIPIKRLGFA